MVLDALPKSVICESNSGRGFHIPRLQPLDHRPTHDYHESQETFINVKAVQGDYKLFSSFQHKQRLHSLLNNKIKIPTFMVNLNQV